jgi:hypothetical protein
MVERWLAGAHARLRRLPPVSGERSARRMRAFPRTRTEAAVSADSRARWLALYHEVQRRYAAGETLLGMSRSMALARSTVRKFAYADSFPERQSQHPVPACWTRSSNIWRRV